MLIQQLANAAHTTKDTIRHYEKLGLLTFSERKAGSKVYRDYGEENVELISIIQKAKAMGFTLRELSEVLGAYMTGGFSTKQKIDLFSQKLLLVNQKIEELKDVKQYIEDKIESLKTSQETP